MRMWEIEIRPEFIGVKKPKRFILPPSLNARMHWAARKKVTDAFKEQAFYAVKAKRVPRLKRVRLELEQHAIRARDRDNLAASLKSIIDGFVQAGIVPDDTEDYVDIRFLKSKRVRTRKEEKLLIYLYAEEEANSKT